ncbi:MAG: hypothetical protein JWN70_4404 [Planctomycetaceae bacterium]|nr:hypothetical protein [Planctomycetaceae bacterium]
MGVEVLFNVVCKSRLSTAVVWGHLTEFPTARLAGRPTNSITGSSDYPSESGTTSASAITSSRIPSIGCAVSTRRPWTMEFMPFGEMIFLDAVRLPLIDGRTTSIFGDNMSAGNTMTIKTNWQETESEVARPGLWFVYLIVIVFLLVGGSACVQIARGAVPGMPLWAGQLLAGAIVVNGCWMVIWAVSIKMWPVRILHATAETLPDLIHEPILQEGSTVHGRLTHELVEHDRGWEFRPADSIWRNDKRFLFGFGIPFLLLVSGILTWFWHGTLGWILAGTCASLATLLCGGTCFTLMGMMLSASFRRLPKLSIPGDGTDLELDSSVGPQNVQPDLAAGISRIFAGGEERQKRLIPRDEVVAVQLCPWRFVAGNSRDNIITWAVQGLIVVAPAELGTYDRLPILLTSDFVGAAQLMQKLGAVLQVPYFYSADAAGWKVEKVRARSRPPLKGGGVIG